ncbi:MAG: hypothetical protein RL169_1100 [Armatimonadota bacterium]|jgi:oligoendopeptidase F
MSTENQLPHWDLTPYFPSLSSDEFKAAYQDVLSQIAALTERFDRYQIGATSDSSITDETVKVYEEVAKAFDTLGLVNNLVTAYVYGYISTDTTNELAQGIASELRGQSVALQTLAVRWVAWLGSIDTDTLKAKSSLASLYAYPLEQAKIGAQHQMSSAEEELAAQLSLSGTAAWGRLHSDITSQLTVPMGDDKKPMAMVRVLSSDADPQVRRDAYEAELATWPTVALPLAAAMNGIKHETNVLATRRGWADPLDEAVWHNGIDRATLEAMLAAAQAAFPDFRRYMQAKAKLLGYDGGLHWFDMFAPVGAESASGRGALPRSLLQHTLTLSHLALETLQGVRSQKTGLMLSHVPVKRAVLSAWGPSQVRVAFFRTTIQALMPLAPLHTSLAMATTTSVLSIVRQRLPAHR